MNDTTKKSMSVVATGALIITVGTFVSRLLGLVKENLINNFTDSAIILDVYRTAFQLPDIVYNLLAGGALSAAFIPVFASLISEGKKEESNRTASSIINVLLLAIIFALTIIFIFTPQLVHIIASTAKGGEFNLIVILTRELSVMVIFTALSGLFTGMLQSYKNYLVPVVIWNVYNIFSILGVAVFSKIPNYAFFPSFLHMKGETVGIHGLALGVITGAIAMAVMQIPYLYKNGFKFYPIFDVKSPSVRQIGILFLPVMIGLALSQFNMLQLPQMLGWQIGGEGGGEGAPNAMYNANRMILLPMGLFAISFSTAAFPVLSKLANDYNKQEFIATFNKSLRSILLFIFPCSVGLLTLAYPVMLLLYAGKNLDYTGLVAASLALASLSIGLVGTSMIQIINRGFYSMKNTLTPVIVNVLMVVTNVMLALVLIKVFHMSVCGIGISATITSTVAAFALFFMLSKKLGGIDGYNTLKISLKMLVSALVMGVVVVAVAHLLAPTVQVGSSEMKISPLSRDWMQLPDFANANKNVPTAIGAISYRMALFVQVAISVSLGALTYLGCLIVLKVSIIEPYVDKFLRKLRIRK